MASGGRKFDEKKVFSNGLRMCPEALGDTLGVARQPRSILTTSDVIWSIFEKIEKILFCSFFQAKFLSFCMVLSGFWGYI